MRKIADYDAQAALQLVGYTWFIDGINDNENWAVYFFGRIAQEDTESLRGIISLPWIADGISGSDKDWVAAFVANLDDQ